MPSVRENLVGWNQTYDWPLDGESWSAAWGNSTAQWYFTILPRIQKLLPADTILEIAPGHGRWTQFLKGLCRKLILIDLSPTCIEACKKRFSSDRHIVYHVNDGTSLEVVPDGSVDFVFSFDSLVHAEADVMKCYLEQLSRKLGESGRGFIHHSNLGDFPRLTWFLKWSKRLHLYGRLAFVANQEHWRASSMTADRFRSICAENGLLCTRQEIINWVGTKFCIDCLSSFARSGSRTEQPRCVTVRNPGFMLEARRARWLSMMYT
jgi:SAM-dependent methyltransferase